MASDQRVSLAHPSISISIVNQRYATFSVAAFQPIISAPLPQGAFRTFFRLLAAPFHLLNNRGNRLSTLRKSNDSGRSSTSHFLSFNPQQLRHTTADAHPNGPRTRKEPLKAAFLTPFSRLPTLPHAASQMPPLGIEPRTY